MHRDLNKLSQETYDLLIIGGGINGLATAWDAVLRGLKVALVDKKDFGAETSSATLNLIHGGLRYLQHLDFVRMRESIREATLKQIRDGRFDLIRPVTILASGLWVATMM